MQTEGGLSAFSLLLKGGPVMIPLAICSILALTIAIERLVSLSRRRVAPAEFTEDFRRNLEKEDFSESNAEQFCEERPSLLASIVRVTLRRWQERPTTIEQAFSDTAAREIGKMKRSLRALKSIAGVAPLLGLLGTVVGMIRAFQTVALSSGSLGRAEMLAQGIYEAMVTTATGLAVAIPTLLIYHYLGNRVDTYADDLEIAGTEICDALRHQQPAPTDNHRSQKEAA